MGTSRSKPDSPPKRPFIPPWADQDPAPPAPEANPPPGQPQPEPADIAPRGRYSGFRTALGRFASSGDRSAARTALGHWARTSTGGSRTGAARVARAARTGGAALAGVARAAAGLAPVAGALDVRTLAGLSIDVAIDRIIDAFCPSGILDEDIARLAIGEALATALSGIDTFDPAALDANSVRVATLTFVGELVFVQIAGDGGKSLAAAPSPTAAAQREADLRSLVREVSDVIGTPILEAEGNVLTPAAMTTLVSRLVQAVEAEISTW
jgi:hypothetical protein